MVADPDICHGKPTFRGTRILVADVLDQVAAGLAWETIIEEWRGSITQKIIALLHRLRRPTCFTRDEDFYARRLCHARYCLVYLAVAKSPTD